MNVLTYEEKNLVKKENIILKQRELFTSTRISHNSAKYAKIISYDYVLELICCALKSEYFGKLFRNIYTSI